MGFCTRRYFLLSICLLQLLAIVERQVFDFLGYLWIPILVNFFEIIFVIFGFFGGFQYRPKYIIAYSIWHLFWLGWNIFIICLYLDIGILDHKTSIVLKLDPQSGTWWVNGPGCKEIVNVSDSIPRVEDVTGCYVSYQHVEIAQAGLQCILAFLGTITGFCLSKLFMEEDDSSSHKKQRKSSKQRMSLYSIEFSPQMEGRNDSDSAEYDHENMPPPMSPKPMTPRRVKRRSVMQRGTSNRHSTSSRRSYGRNSTRSSRRTAQNPVTRLLEQQQKIAQYENANTPSPVDPLPYYSNVSPPINYNPSQNQPWNGHANPTYQQSSMQSLNEPDDLEDLYNNRPASVRSSYSNFHGTRPLNYGVPPHQYQHSHATPQVPQKRNTPNRQSMRSMAFLNNGPPAYTSQGPLHHNHDSETTI